MKKLLTIFSMFVLLTILSDFGPVIQKIPLIAGGAKLIMVSDRFSFTEGPAPDPYGNVYFTDQPNNVIMKWSQDGTVSTYMEDAGRANGLYFDMRGNLLACADLNNELWQIDQHKEVTVLIKDFGGKKLNGPNDLWVDPNNGVYFTDPYYQRDYWTRTEKEIKKEQVYFLTPDREKIMVVEDGLVQPNGIIGTPDGKMLYIADIKADKTYSYMIEQDGSLSRKELFAKMGSDGMTIDNFGNVYLTGDGVTIFSSKGEKLEHIKVNQDWTANVTFGGRDQHVLFITASKAIYTLQMNVRGVRFSN